MAMKFGLSVFALAVSLGLFPAQTSNKKTGWGEPSSETKTYVINKSYTTLSFTAIKWKVFKEEGIFQDFNGALTYSASDPAKCKIDVTVQAVSLDTRNSTRDNVLRSDDFFDVVNYPTLAFHSARITSTGNGSYQVAGNLTIHGITKQITIPVQTIGVRVMPDIGEFAGFETTFTIDRREFGVLGTRWSGNTVAIDPTISIHLLIGGVRERK
jgi:polyisoprenoid-binding protein YceI